MLEGKAERLGTSERGAACSAVTGTHPHTPALILTRCAQVDPERSVWNQCSRIHHKSLLVLWRRGELEIGFSGRNFRSIPSSSAPKHGQSRRGICLWEAVCANHFCIFKFSADVCGSLLFQKHVQASGLLDLKRKKKA